MNKIIDLSNLTKLSILKGETVTGYFGNKGVIIKAKFYKDKRLLLQYSSSGWLNNPRELGYHRGSLSNSILIAVKEDDGTTEVYILGDEGMYLDNENFINYP